MHIVSDLIESVVGVCSCLKDIVAGNKRERKEGCLGLSLMVVAVVGGIVYGVILLVYRVVSYVAGLLF